MVISCPQTDHLKHENALENLNCLEVRTANKSPHHCLTVNCALCHIYFPRHSYNPCATKHIHDFYLTTNCTNYTNIARRHPYTFGQFVKFVFNFYHANIGVERELPEGAIHRSSGCRYVSLRLLWVSCFAHSKKCAICHNYLSNLNL